MWILERYRTRREISRWCRDYKLLAANILNRMAADLIRDVDPLLQEAGWVEGVFQQGRFLAERIAPRVHALAEPVVERIVEEAQQSLARITAGQPEPDDPPSPPPERPPLIGWQDDVTLASGIAPSVSFPAEMLRQRVRTYILAKLAKGNRKEPSILTQLKTLFDEAADKARRG